MSLSIYNKKRKFEETSEPSGKKAKENNQLSFVVQRHKASHLHYDFRLEMEGVLKSWAVPKGPSLNPQDKRLAMMVEDHPYDYKDFEGVIPKGNYGAGIVEVWDKGYYTALTDDKNADQRKLLKAGLKAGNLKFVLKGKKLKGEFALVKIKSRTGDKDNTWLLIKHNDKYAVNVDYDSEKETLKTSPINKALAQKDKPEIAKKKVNYSSVRANPKKISDYIQPMLAKEATQAFDGEGWIYEIKWDGYRAIAETDLISYKLYSRNGNDFSNSYPIVYNELRKIKHKVVLDGEIVVLNEKGFPDFQKLQHYSENQNFPICYYVFDLLEMDNEKLYHLPLINRKELLKLLLPKSDIIRFSDHVTEKGIEFFEAAIKKDLEGIMAKKADGEYYVGKRTNEWLKIKNHKTADVIICGYTEPTGSRQYFGSLVLGLMKDKKLVHVGHAGSGYDDKKLKEVFELLQPLVQKNSPFVEKIVVNNKVTWVKPAIICEIKFTEWTGDQKLRHPVFLRIRIDKTIHEISLEELSHEKISSQKTSKKIAVEKFSKEKGNKKLKKNENGFLIKDGKNSVALSHPDKIYFPDDKVTKQMVAEYYQQIAPYLLPFLKDRPQSLLRNPGGINGKGFFHKDAGENAPDFVKTFAVHSDSSDKVIDYIICNDKATLAYLNNLGCIELNPWHSTTKFPDKPDYMIIDIDPSDKNSFDQVIETANSFKKVLDKAGAKSFCKTSGATGLHIYIPMKRKYDYEEVKNFAQLICMYVQEMLPDFTTMERNLKKRGNNHIYLDYLQNRSGQTISSVYSLRPKKGATVSMPLEWNEVKKGLSPQMFTIFNSIERIQTKPDLFKGIFSAGTNIETCLKLLSK